MNLRNKDISGGLPQSLGILTSLPSVKSTDGRIHAIDLARGIAVALMILSHGVNGLMPFDNFPEWGKQIHLFTKFSSSLFILIFGISLVIAHLPHVTTPDWRRRKIKMLLGGVVILFWYKILTIFEMLDYFEPAEIIDTLLYRSFPSYVEILGFYAIALLWAPFVLAVWAKTPLYLRLLSPLILILITQFLSNNFHFWGSEPLEAILIEHENYYTWGQFARGPLVLVGMLFGELILAYHKDVTRRMWLIGFFVLCSVLLFAAFFISTMPDTIVQLSAIAQNIGKHPPGLDFMLFSVGGAILILSLCLMGGDRLAMILRPITIIGTDALKAFVFHIFVIFIIFRYLLGLRLNIAYPDALILALILIPATALWIKITSWISEKR